METKFFLTEKIDEDDIKNLIHLQETKTELYDEIKNWFLKQNEYPRIDKKLTVQFAKNTDSNAEEVIDTFGSIYWLNKLLVEYEEDSPDDFVNDLKKISPESILNEDLLLERVKGIADIACKYKLLVKSLAAKGEGAPTLKSSSSCVIIKPVIEKRFDFDSQDIKDYKPIILKNEACVLIELQDSNDKHISFQMDSENFERFLNDLIALQIELNSVKDGRS